jgi:two-component system response regulator AtoC
MLPDQPRLIIVDDDPVTCEMLCEVFATEGFASCFVQSGEDAMKLLADESLDVLVSDIRMKTSCDGLALLDHVRQEYPHLPVVLMTAFGSVDTAVRAVKQGAFDYVSKPFDIDALVGTVRRALAARSIHRPERGTDDDEQHAPGLVGRTPAMLEVYKMIARVSDSPASVLITGESGTGKELVARAIHMHGARHLAPFVAINCGALTETLLESELFGHVRGSFTGAVANKPGIFEQAQAGTVFLDEISEMSTGLQVKLLRVLQERELVPVGGSSPITVNARVIAASSRDPETLMSSESFRHDLLYRLNVINIQLPPLRKRREDISLLAGHFVRKHTPRDRTPPQLTDDALAYLADYPWPGNVRELENAIERAVTLNSSGPIMPGDLPRKIFKPHVQDPSPNPADDIAPLFAGLPSIEEMQRRYLLHVLDATGGNRKRAAEVLGINRRTLYRMAARFGIDLSPGAGESSSDD